MRSPQPSALSEAFARRCGNWRSEIRADAAAPLDRLLWANPEFQVRSASTGGEIYELELPSFGRSRIDFASRSVSFAFSGAVDAQTVEHLLADQVLPRILAHSGVLVVHAAAVLIEGRAVLLVGRSGSGKSTLAASFVTAGYTLLGDDAIIIEEAGGRLLASAVYQSLRLFPDSVRNALGDDRRTRAVAQYTTKRRVEGLHAPAGDLRFPIAAVFVIDGPTAAEIALAPISGADSCIALLEHSFWLDPHDPDRIRDRMTKAGTLAAQTATWTLTYPRAYAQLPSVLEVVIGRSTRVAK